MHVSKEKESEILYSLAYNAWKCYKPIKYFIYPFIQYILVNVGEKTTTTFVKLPSKDTWR